jgi:hypothetical protein
LFGLLGAAGVRRKGLLDDIVRLGVDLDRRRWRL